MINRRAAAITVLAAALALTGCSSGSSGAPASSPASTPTTSSSSPSPTPTRTKPAAPTLASVRTRARKRIATIERHQPSGAISLAAVNLSTGKSFAMGASGGMWTASAYKLFVLETLLLRRQDEGSSLSSYELGEATPMIEQSDNVAGYALWEDAGGNAALQSAADRFGMTHTVADGTDPTFTTTSGIDCLHLLRNLVNPKGPLTSYSRNLVLGLMRNVESDQRWGVGVVADKGSTFYNKNGWLNIDNTNGPGEDDNGLWVANSLGIVQVHHQRLLMAVLTRHQPDFDTGVALVQRLARILAPAVVKPT